MHFGADVPYQCIAAPSPGPRGHEVLHLVVLCTDIRVMRLSAAPPSLAFSHPPALFHRSYVQPVYGSSPPAVLRTMSVLRVATRP
eukprot:7325617-Pyramimonas_sp.AAC.1